MWGNFRSSRFVKTIALFILGARSSPGTNSNCNAGSLALARLRLFASPNLMIVVTEQILKSSARMRRDDRNELTCTGLAVSCCVGGAEPAVAAMANNVIPRRRRRRTTSFLTATQQIHRSRRPRPSVWRMDRSLFPSLMQVTYN